jgi:hypothetical protein
MTSWHSKLFTIFLALAMCCLIAAPASARSKHKRKHGKHVAAPPHAPKHRKPAKHA